MVFAAYSEYDARNVIQTSLDRDNKRRKMMRDAVCDVSQETGLLVTEDTIMLVGKRPPQTIQSFTSEDACLPL